MDGDLNPSSAFVDTPLLYPPVNVMISNVLLQGRM